MLPTFVQGVWELLVSTGNQPKYDMLVSEAIHFLSNVSKKPKQRALFAEPNTLKLICEKVGAADRAAA